MAERSIPTGMTQVTKEAFYGAVRDRDIHPNSERRETFWMLRGDRTPFGWSSRGYAGPFDYEGAPPEVFAIRLGVAHG